MYTRHETRPAPSPRGESIVGPSLQIRSANRLPRIDSGTAKALPSPVEGTRLAITRADLVDGAAVWTTDREGADFGVTRKDIHQGLLITAAEVVEQRDEAMPTMSGRVVQRIANTEAYPTADGRFRRGRE